jgi:hypothetical protein
MKRSEMRKRLKAVMRAYGGLIERHVNGEISYGVMAEQFVGAILDEAEELGMLPPEIVNPKVKHLHILAHADEVANDNLYDRRPRVDPNYYVNEWEAE